MPINSIQHDRLLINYFRDNPLWAGLAEAMDALVNPNLQAPTETLQRLRTPDVEAHYAFLNARMLGFKIPSLAFTDAQLALLMRNLGKFRLTCGSSNNFIKFLGFILKVEFIYVDLWANSLDMPIINLVQKHGSPIWQGGDWFPTSYFDIVYSLAEFPGVNEAQFRTFVKQLAPKHLVLRQIVGIDTTTANIYLTAIPLDRQRTTSIARPV